MTKHSFLALDGLRGLAAVAVLLFHRRFLVSLDFFAHAYLAVDFFFMLSGFVVAYSYETKLRQGMSLIDFLLIRAIRLYPLIFLGVILGIPAAIFHHGLEVLIDLPFALLAIPFDSRSFFVFDPPTWSLFFEIVINIVFALTAVRMRLPLLATLIAGLAVSLAAMMYWFGAIQPFVGWADFLASGLTRVGFSFFAGVGLYRLYQMDKLNLGVDISETLLAAVLITIFIIPRFAFPIDIFFDLTVIIIVFPVLIVGAINVRQCSSLSRLMGELSYPVYIIHWPLLLLASGALKYFGYKVEGATYLIAYVLLVFGASYLALRCYDEPIRAKLKGLMSKVERQRSPFVADKSFR